MIGLLWGSLSGPASDLRPRPDAPTDRFSGCLESVAQKRCCTVALLQSRRGDIDVMLVDSGSASSAFVGLAMQIKSEHAVALLHA